MALPGNSSASKDEFILMRNNQFDLSLVNGSSKESKYSKISSLVGQALDQLSA